MKVSKIIETLGNRRSWLLGILDNVEPDTGRWHRINQEQRAIECALPILELELMHRRAEAVEAREAA